MSLFRVAVSLAVNCNNFIINTGNATSKDIRNLIELVHSEVLKKYKINLVMEQEYIGWD